MKNKKFTELKEYCNNVLSQEQLLELCILSYNNCEIENMHKIEKEIINQIINTCDEFPESKNSEKLKGSCEIVLKLHDKL